MDWILYRGRTFHTYLPWVLAPIREEIKDFKWFISDLKYMGGKGDISINFDENYFILNKDEFDIILSNDIQFIWGCILGFPDGSQISFDPDALPYVEGNDDMWKPGNIQIPEAVIEIDCYDSSATIVKFSDERLSEKFHDYFPDFMPLGEFKG